MEKDPENAQVTEESLRNLIREQKRMNSEMLAELEQIKATPLPISHDIQYIKSACWTADRPIFCRT